MNPPTSVAIGAHTQIDFIANITESTAQPALNLVLYEIRVTMAAASPLIVNCFAFDSDDKIVGTNTVLHAQLVSI